MLLPWPRPCAGDDYDYFGPTDGSSNSPPVFELDPSPREGQALSAAWLRSPTAPTSPGTFFVPAASRGSYLTGLATHLANYEYLTSRYLHLPGAHLVTSDLGQYGIAFHTAKDYPAELVADLDRLATLGEGEALDPPILAQVTYRVLTEMWDATYCTRFREVLSLYGLGEHIPTHSCAALFILFERLRRHSKVEWTMKEGCTATIDPEHVLITTGWSPQKIWRVWEEMSS